MCCSLANRPISSGLGNRSQPWPCSCAGTRPAISPARTFPSMGAGLRSKLAGRWRILLMHLLHRRFAEMEKGRKPSLPALFSLIADARRYALQDWVSLPGTVAATEGPLPTRSEEHTSEHQS